MKESQWVIAAVVLAALVFVVVFASQFIGTSNQPTHTDDRGKQVSKVELHFIEKVLPFGPYGQMGELMTAPHEVEEKSRGGQDFFFLNTNNAAVKVGVNRTSCQCSAVEVFVLPGDGAKWVAGVTRELVSAGASGPLSVALSYQAVLADAKARAKGTELLSRSESADVPAGAAGWARLGFNADKVGSKALSAILWFNSPEGRIATLETSVVTHEVVRVRPFIEAGTLNRGQLEKGVALQFHVWSSTRPDFTVTAESASPGDRKADPLLVGEPVRLTREELRRLDEENFTSPPPGDGPNGRALSAWRVTLTLNALAPDGKTPFEVGPFRRSVLVRSPALSEPRSITVRGRVRGLIEIGNDDDSSDVMFGPFPRVKGKKTTLSLSSPEPGVKLTFDRARTPAFLNATLPEKPDVLGERSSWKIEVEVLKGKASGQFPRRGDPLYEDAAFYFKAQDQKGVVHPVRVAAHGTATE